MGTFNDNQAQLEYTGNLSLGGAGFDDGAGDATYPYAKGDVWFPIPVADIISDTQPVLTRIGAGSYKRTLVASTTHNLLIPVSAAFFRTFVATVGHASNPHGTLLNSVALAYRTNTNDLTSITLKAYSLSLAAATSVPAAVELTSTIAGAVVTQAANQRLAVATVTTPAWLNVLDTLYVVEAVIVTPASCTCDILGASVRCSLALY